MAAIRLIVIFLVTVLFVLIESAPSSIDTFAQEFAKHASNIWSEYKRTHHKNYSDEDDKKRQELFLKQLMTITLQNIKYDLGMTGYRLGFNYFSDYDDDVWDKEFGECYKASNKSYDSVDFADIPIHRRQLGDNQLPSSIDWRDKNVVSPVRFQGSCGSCYAFGTAGAIEGQYSRKIGKPVALSPQQIVDCGKEQGLEGVNGCQGGTSEESYALIQQLGGIETWNDYPYRKETQDQKQEGQCQIDLQKVVTTIQTFKRMIKDENAILEAVALYGPVATTVNGKAIKGYGGGIIDDPDCSPEPNHLVLIVGYGSENGKDYWIVKNSWGESWGENGYFRIVRGKNMCGIANDATFPILA